MSFTKAVRTQSRLRIALAAPSGGGKTWSSLVLATPLAAAIGSRVALVDAESGSSNLYANDFDFDAMDLPDPSVDSYIAAIKLAESSGYKVLILDGISPEWDWLLGIVDKTSERSKFNAWATATPMHDAFVKAMKDFKGHLFATIRSKTSYEIETDEKGKKVPKKIGLKPQQRDGLEYEFDAWLDLDVANLASSTKDRLHLFEEPRVLTAVDGQLLADWVLGVETEIEARRRQLADAAVMLGERAALFKSKEEFAKARAEAEKEWGFRGQDGAIHLPDPMREALAVAWEAFNGGGAR